MKMQDIRRANLREWFSKTPVPAKEKSYLSQVMSGKAPFGEKAARRLEKDYKMDDGYLDRVNRPLAFTDQPSESFVSTEKTTKALASVSVEFITFKKLCIPASAGTGSATDSYQIDAFEDFNVAAWWASRFVGSIDTNKIKVVPCRGDSMSPTIPDGSMLFVDTSIRCHVGDGIYCLNIDDRLIVKRVNILTKDRAFEVVSDNPKGPKTETYGMNDEERMCVSAEKLFRGWLLITQPNKLFNLFFHIFAAKKS